MFVLKLVVALVIIIAALVLVFRFHKRIKGEETGLGLGKKTDEAGSPELEAFIAAYHRDKTLGGAQPTTPPPEPVTQPAQTVLAAVPVAAKARAAFLSGPSKLGFLVLKAGLPDHHVFANTRLSDLLDGLAVPALANLRVDLVVCNKDLAVVAAVDLPNGVQTDSPMEREKEQRLRAAGIRYLRFVPGTFPKPAQVRGLIYNR